MRQKSLKKLNSSVLLLFATILEKLCYVGTTLLITRSISLSDFGKLSFALYAGFAVATVADFGFQPILVKEIINNPKRKNAVFGVALFLKIPLAIVAVLALVLAIAFTRMEQDQAQLLWVLGLSQIMLTVSYVGNGVFRSAERLEIEALANLARGLIYAVMVVGSILINGSTMTIAWSILVANTISMILSLSFACAIIRPTRSLSMLADARIFLGQTTPLGISIITSTIFSMLSVVFLRLSVADMYVGWYNSAHALTSHLFILPEVVMAALLPPMIGVLKQRKTDTEPLTESVLVMLLLSLPIALGTSLLAPGILQLVFGAKFVPAASTLAISIWVLPFYFINVAYVLFCSTQNKQTVWLLLVFIGIIVSSVGLQSLVPKFGINGAAVARLGGEFTLCLAGTILLRKSLNGRRLVSGSIRIIVVLMVLPAILFISNSIPVFLSIGLSAAAYVMLSLFFGPWPAHSWRILLAK